MIEYTQQIGESIGRLIAEGASMRKICEEVPDIPSRSTLLRWMHEYPEFDAICARARLIQAELFAEKMIDCIEDTDPDNCNAMKVKMGGYQWLMARMASKRWGDKITHQGDEDKPIELVVRHIGSDTKLLNGK